MELKALPSVITTAYVIDTAPKRKRSRTTKITDYHHSIDDGRILGKRYGKDANRQSN
jgi:hypothetical protein